MPRDDLAPSSDYTPRVWGGVPSRNVEDRRSENITSGAWNVQPTLPDFKSPVFSPDTSSSLGASLGRDSIASFRGTPDNYPAMRTQSPDAMTFPSIPSGGPFGSIAWTPDTYQGFARGTNMVGLQRGMLRGYADGGEVPDVAPTPVRTIPVSVPANQQAPVTSAFQPPPPAPEARSFRQMLGDAIGMRGPDARNQVFGGGGGSSDMATGLVNGLRAASNSGAFQALSGQYAEALANPNAAPITKSFAEFKQASDTARRMQQLTGGPSYLERAANFFGGNDAWQKDIDARTDAANEFRTNKLLQQHVLTHPDRLKEAEANPAAFVAGVRNDPTFAQTVKNTTAHYNNLSTNGATHVDDQGWLHMPPDKIRDLASVSKILATVPGTTPMQATAAIQPQDFSREHFIRAFNGVPLDTIARLFGAQLAHIATPKEQIERNYFAGQEQMYQNKAAQLKKLSIDPVKNKADIDQINADMSLLRRQQLYDAQVAAGIVKPLEGMRPIK